MKLRYGIVLFILLVGFSGLASAIGPETPNMTFASSKEWLVANNADSALLTLRDNNNPIQAISVEFNVNNTDMAAINRVPVTIGQDGTGTSLLYSKTKSGVVEVYANVTYKTDRSNTSEPLKYLYYTILQKIDHDTPYAIAPDDTFPNGVVTVGTQLPITIHITDYWGNLVENRNPATLEKINMSIQGSPGDLAVLKNGGSWVNAMEIPVDSQGNFNTTLKISTHPGFQSILVKPLAMPISEKPYYVRGVANGVPETVISRVEIAEGGIGSSEVSPPYIEADGFSRYFITYTLYDLYGNPVSDRILNFSTTIPGEEQFLPATTDLGEVRIYYGPKDQVGTVTLNAVSVDNPNATASDTVKFINSTATEMLVTANPETMPSIDAVPGFTSEIMAKVIDENGNGVPGETVTFTLGTPTYAENYTITSSPSLVGTSAVTDSDGYATVSFIPGGFTTNWADSKYDDTATGRVNVIGTWNSTPRSLLLTWKNYPYLSAETFATPNVVNVTDNVTVTLWLKGDGWALQPSPIDVMLTIDRSGSMVYDNPDRMHSVRQAAKVFTNNMSGVRDRVGLVTFGRSGAISRAGVNSGIDISYVNNVYIVPRTYSDYATLDRALTYNSTDVKNELDKIVPDHGTPMRSALKKSIDNLVANGRPKAVKAVVILSDGDYNWYGDPLARGTGRSTYTATQYYSSGSWHNFNDLTTNYAYFSELNSTDQNLSRYAKDYGIRIYSIAFADTISVDGKTTLRTLAEGSGGKYYNATSANIDAVYTAIAGDLKEEAGVNTQADLYYGTVNVNQVPTSDVFDYVYKSGVSTMTKSYWKNGTTIYGPNYYDQTADWSDKVLSFNVGTIKLNQTWMTSYMLKANKPGNIDVFGPGSYISFNNNASQLLLPKTLITALPDMSTTGGVNFTKTLTINNLTATVNENTNLADLSVEIKILPSSPNLSVVADIYITDEDQHTTTWIKSIELAPVINGWMHITTIDLSQYQRGKQYTFYVDFVNKQPGTNPVYWAQLSSNNFVMMRKPAGVYIRLE